MSTNGVLHPIGETAQQILAQTQRDRARALQARATGIEDAGMTDLAREVRLVATMLLDTLDQLEQERSARTALKTRCETLQAIVGKAAYQACDP